MPLYIDKCTKHVTVVDANTRALFIFMWFGSYHFGSICRSELIKKSVLSEEKKERYVDDRRKM